MDAVVDAAYGTVALATVLPAVAFDCDDVAAKAAVVVEATQFVSFSHPME